MWFNTSEMTDGGFQFNRDFICFIWAYLFDTLQQLRSAIPKQYGDTNNGQSLLTRVFLMIAGKLHRLV